MKAFDRKLQKSFHKYHRWSFTALSTILLAVTAAGQSNDPVKVARIKRLSFEELLNVEVSSVSGHAEKIPQTPSAIQVITGEDIHRSGASSLPEALRLASNLEVAQVNSHDWAISARGFNNTLANKLLVLIDGRTIYTPLYAGVFWDAQNVMLDDVDRIEVISGPGATLWGANAVNGVINIVSKSARDTQGTIISGGGGSLLNEFGQIRYGDKISTNVFFRIYGMGFNRDTSRRLNGTDGTDGWVMGQGGARLDWYPSDDSDTALTFIANGYAGEENKQFTNTTLVNGQNLLGRWTKSLYEGSDYSIQAYWDRTYRKVPNSFSENLNTYDVTFQHRLPIGSRHSLLWGTGYRLMQDRVSALTPNLAFLPAHRDLQLFSGFLQDEITLVPDKLTFTLGTKLEHNDYSGFEFQPSARIAWAVTPRQLLWAAVSRAVRSPSRVDADLYAPAPPAAPTALAGGPGFDSEKLTSYEVGYRVQARTNLALSLASYYNFYDDLRSVDRLATNVVVLGNHFEGEVWGIELSANYQPLDWWRLRGGYNYLHKKLSPTSSVASPSVREGNDPEHQFSLQSVMDFRGFVKGRDHFQFDVTGRYVDALHAPRVPNYIEADVRLAWEYKDDLELAIVGQNLLDNRHAEFGTPTTRLEIPRSVYGKVTWRF